MKKTLQVIILLLFCGKAFCQNKREAKTHIEVDEMIENLDVSQMTSGILLERSGNFSNLKAFNENSKEQIVDYKYFRQALLDLNLASNKEKFISSAHLKEILSEKRMAHDIVHIGVISADYQSLNYIEGDKASSGLTIQNNRFVKQKGKDAFLNQSSTIISPLKLACKGNTITYKFANEFWFNNSKKTIKKLVIDFGNNEKYLIIKDGKIIKNEVQKGYMSTGEKELNYSITYLDNTTTSSKSKIYVITEDANSRNVSSRIRGKIENGFTTADIAYRGYYDENEVNAIFGRIDYRIHYRLNEGSNPKLKKPIIIIDGFDPGDFRRIEDEDCANDPDCAKKFVNCGAYKPERHLSIRDLMQPTYTNDRSKNLIPTLRNLGYDVIIVNHPVYYKNGRKIDGGGDFIERNALTLTKLIRDVNKRVENNGFNKDMVVAGPSMGGQISRYALAYMEKRQQESRDPKWNHHTRLWISIDSPHLGANIPLGLQALIYQMSEGGVDAAQEIRHQQLNSPAAKQQLIEQIYRPKPFDLRKGGLINPTYLDGRTKSQGFSNSRGALEFQRYYNNLFNNGLPNSKGYPQNVGRKIALVNGSMSGSKKYANPYTGNPNDKFANDGERVFELVAFQNLIRPWPLDPLRVHIASLETNFMPAFGTHAALSRFKQTRADYVTYLTNNNSRGCMDNISGGWFNGQEELHYGSACTYPPNAQGSFWSGGQSMIDNVLEGISSLLGGADWETRVLKESHSFISSFSAIGHLRPDTNWSQALNKNLVCQNLTPFDSYFGQEKNTKHTTFNKESIAWLLAELSGDAQEPYFPVSSNILKVYNSSGTNEDNILCENKTKQYNIDSCSAPGDVESWSTSSNLSMHYNQSNLVVVKAKSNSRSSGWIKATFSNGLTLKKDVWIGAPKYHTVENGAEICINSFERERYRIPNSPYIDSYEVTSDSPHLVVYGGEGVRPGSSITFMGTKRGFYLVKFKATNKCGSTTSFVMVAVEECFGSGDGGIELDRNADLESELVNTDNQIKVYPNPVDHMINISINAKEPNKNLEVKLFDHLGWLIQDVYFEGHSASINTAKLPDGIYILKVFSDHYVETKKIVVKH